MIRIWGRPTSICTQRALWALEEAGCPYELTLASGTMGPAGHVSKGGQPFGVVDTAAYREMNPNGTVPTIDDGGYVLWESNAIVLYVAAKYAPGRMYGGDVGTLARASQWMSWTNEHLEPLLHTLVMHLVRLPPAQRSEAEAKTAFDAILRPLAILDRELASRGHLASDSFSLGDIAAGCAVYRWMLFAPTRPSLPNVEAWQRRLAERAGFARHVAPREFHLSG